MDRRERIGSPFLMIKAALSGFQSGLWTALPATVAGIGFNANLMTVQAQPAVQAQVRTPSGSWVNATLPLCVDCPVLFSGGGGYVGTFPLAAGDEGLLVFASRCIDAWWQSGKVSPQAELRMHDLSDGFFVPLAFSNPNAAKVSGGASATEAQIRTYDGSVMARINAPLKQAGLVAAGSNLVVDGVANKVSVTAAGGLWVNGVMVNVP